MKHKNREAGSMTLETAIVVPIFIFIFLAIYGIFGVVAAQNQISHAFVQSVKSMSLDPFLIERTDLAGEDSSRVWGSLKDFVIDIVRLDNDPYFMALGDWYSTEKMTDDDKLTDGSYDLSGVLGIPQRRFVGYFADGDINAADERLRRLGVVDGMSGIKFDMSKDGNALTVTIEYELEFVFNFFEAARIPMKQSLRVKLWT